MERRIKNQTYMKINKQTINQSSSKREDWGDVI